MKLALITDPKGFKVVDMFQMAYHLVLAQHVKEGSKYFDFYKEKKERGHFIMMDNGAAEDGVLEYDALASAISLLRPDEVILPDVLMDMNATIEATMDDRILSLVPPKQRAVVPQGNSLDEWFACANYFVESLDFATMCVPKHLERFEAQGGRNTLLETIKRAGWHQKYHIHMLGIWGDPFDEVYKWNHHEWIRGLDTAVSFAWAQNKLDLRNREWTGHVGHSWGSKLDITLAANNVEALWEWVWCYK